MNKRCKLSPKISFFLFVGYLLYAPLITAQGTITIPEVNLKPTKTLSAKAATSIQTTVITKEEIAKTPVVNLGEMLQQHQSIVRIANNSADGSPVLSLRGFGDNAVANSLILIDGFPLTNPSLLAPNFNMIALADIERVDIVEGSRGSLWGDQAVGGVINIITKHPKKLFATGMMGYGSYGKNFYSLLIGDKATNGLFIKAYGFFNREDGYRPHSGQKDGSLAAQVGWDYAKGTLSISLQSDDLTTNFVNGLSWAAFKANPSQATNSNNYNHLKTQSYRLLSKQELTADWLLETRIAQQETNGDGFVMIPFERTDSEAIINPRLLGTYRQNKMMLGYQAVLSRYQLTNAMVQAQTRSTQQNLYLQTVTPITPQFDFTFGTRYAWQNNTIENIGSSSSLHVLDKVWVSEQGISFHPNNAWSFFLRRDGNFSFPKANEDLWVPANVKALNAQTGVSYEAGANWQTELQHAQINLYHLDTHNEIAFNPMQTADQPFGSFNNLDETVRNGVTLTEFYRLLPALSVNGQFNFVDARFKAGMNADNRIPAVPALTGNIGFNYAWDPNWQLNYYLLYSGNRYASKDVQNISRRIPAYVLNNIALQYQLKYGLASFEVQNIFNRNYVAYAYYDPNANENTYYPGLGRNFLLTLKVNIE